MAINYNIVVSSTKWVNLDLAIALRNHGIDPTEENINTLLESSPNLAQEIERASMKAGLSVIGSRIDSIKFK